MEKDRSEALKQKAYEIWEREGRPEGMHDEHWAQAQRELDESTTAKPKAGRSRNKPVPVEAAAGIVADVPVKKTAPKEPTTPAAQKPKRTARTAKP